MTLEEHFKLTRPPFPKAATKEALLMTAALEHVIGRLHFAISRDTIALLIAEAGCGKSTALSVFCRGLDAATYNVISTSMTTLSPFSFIAHLVAGTGLPGRHISSSNVTLRISPVTCPVWAYPSRVRFCTAGHKDIRPPCAS